MARARALNYALSTLPAYLARCAFALLTLVACGSPPVDPAIVEDRDGLRIRRDLFTVATPAPPPNPDGTATPEALNHVTVVRYRLDTGTSPPKPARAVVVLIAGFLGGAGGFDALARALVRRSKSDDALEAWAIDRRENNLEDRAGLELALDAGLADRAVDYYFDGGTAGSQTFAGFLPQAQPAFMSEWGLAVHQADVRAVLAKVPDARSRVVLLGHSLGGQLAAQYAAWDFDGEPGYSQLAGLVLVDAVSGGEGQAAPFTREQYETTGYTAPDGFGKVNSLLEVRSQARFYELPLLGTRLFPIGFTTALRARLNPDGLERDVPRAEALKSLFLVDRLPPLTNRAAFGLAFDVESCPLSIASVNAGKSSGPMQTVSSPFGGGTLLRPSSVSERYSWVEYDAVTPRELTSLTDFALAWTRSGVDFGEWYFPTRLSLDAAAASSLTLTPSDWQWSAHGLYAGHGAEIDVPVLALAAGLVQHASAYDRLKALLPAIGRGRPHAETPRSDPAAFTALEHPELSHLDPLAGADDEGSPVRGWYDAVALFARSVTPEGGATLSP